MKRFTYLLAALLALLILPVAFAATAPPQVGTVTLTSSQTSVAGSGSVTLTWNATATADGSAVTSCQPSWQTATVGSSGTASVTVSATTTYTLTCSWTDLSAVLNWTPPTLNTDGSAIGGSEVPLTYSVFAGPQSKETPLTSGVAGAPVTVGPFSAGTECFVLTAVPASGGMSPPSNEVCKTLGTETAKATTTVAVSAVPQAPTNLTVQ